MQQDGCEEIQILISRFVDDEVSPFEREQVEQHIATCDDCAYKLLEYMEMAAIFSEMPLRQPEPDLRQSLFREIGNIKEEARLREEAAAHAKERPWFLPLRPDRASTAQGSTFVGRLVLAASPFAVAAAALFVFLGALLIGGKLTPETPVKEARELHPPPYLPTLEAPIEVTNVSSGGVPSPVETHVGLANTSPPASSTSLVNATATLGRDTIIKLAQPTPVFESDDPSSAKANWHTLRDPAYGYTMQYPPNWWTRVVGDVRYFYPWTAGGTRFAPYWVEMRVSDNSRHFTAANANADICGGGCKPITSSDGEAVWLRRSVTDVDNFYDEAYIFDSAHIYQFRVSVPRGEVPGADDFQGRVSAVQGVFGLMSGRLSLASAHNSADSAYGGVLFLNGSDLWMADAQGKGSYRVTRNLRIKGYAQSPDLMNVAFTASATDSKDGSDLWARSVYLTQVSADGPVAPTLLLSGMEVHDIAWYSDHELLALARDEKGSLSIYSLLIPPVKTNNIQTSVAKIVTLPDTLVGAKSLAVSPDRQLITFLAPVSENQGTDIFGVRPDGSDLVMLVSHSVPVSRVGSMEAPVLAPENQAIKSYVWADGHLESSGYAANLLFTCGNSSGPISYPGGLLFSSPGAARNPLVDAAGLVSDRPERMQIINIAYSPQGKVALAGYMNDVNQRADQIVGLWTGDLVQGTLVNLEAQPLPERPNGVADLQWSPDGKSLIYREIMPSSELTVSWRYDRESDFRLMKLDLDTKATLVLHDGEKH